ncbi:hypothetical protein L1987_84611 [Smallanthus sonchifolius]|uniref:Uncharacterized protein n=1 Tax=Smallanthus sonchifolius TaxID=185202 RepID=A0ACB8XUM9_9ASTR|nr:hypothetical protein L1987_84611 [Smallanthus sonchifolius]
MYTSSLVKVFPIGVELADLGGLSLYIIVTDFLYKYPIPNTFSLALIYHSDQSLIYHSDQSVLHCSGDH